MIEVEAPWMPHLVDKLNEQQRDVTIHPFTCPHRGTPIHNWYDGDLGTLLATTSGWVCRDCGYRQNWARVWPK